MSNDFLMALNEEIVGLEETLSHNLAFQRWRELQKVRALYNSPQAFPGTSAYRATARKASPERANALIKAKELLENRTEPTPTREIYEFLQRFDVEIAGKDPVSNLSAMLSNSDDFESNGRAGWTLKSFNSNNIISNSVYEEISENEISSLSEEQIRDTLSFIMTNSKIPQDVDGRLLAQCRDVAGRHLKDHEMRELRQIFGQILEKRVQF